MNHFIAQAGAASARHLSACRGALVGALAALWAPVRAIAAASLLLACAQPAPDRPARPAADEPSAHAATPGPATAATSSLPLIRALIGAAPCTASAQCQTLALGAKPCGGAAFYLPWSNWHTDGPQLAALAARYQAAPALPGLLSDCRIVGDPGAECRIGPAAAATGQCVLRERVAPGLADPR